MKEVAETFEELEATTKRLQMSEILGELFRKAGAEEVDKVIYLLHGRLGPPFENIEFGVDERLILLALISATGRSADDVERLYKARGDLGLATEELLQGPGESLSLGEVFTVLESIAQASGTGAQQRKVRLTTDLLRRLSGPEAKYVVRVLQGKLRLGVGDATIMDALSWASTGNYSLRPVIEKAYNLSSDLGLVGRVLLSKGAKALEEMKPQVGRPIRVELAERLPSAEAIIKKMGRVEAEPKYDGLRLQLHKDGQRVRFFTRRLEDVTGMFPELAEAAVRQISVRDAILDGEALVYNPETGEFLPFQVTVQRKRKYRIEEMGARYPLRLFVFDLLYASGQSYIDRPLSERRRELDKILTWDEDDPIRPTERLITDNPEELDHFFTDMVNRGLEGIVVKKPDAVYQAGQRSFNWVKLKRGYQAELRDTVDVVLVGYLTGKGKRAKFGIGSLLGAVYDPENDRFRTVSKIGSGLTDEEWGEMKRLLDENRTPGPPPRVDSIIVPDVWSTPKYVVEVQADEITRSPKHTCGKVGKEPGYALRFPRVLDWIRTDKGPEDATTEQEILEMYRMQFVTGEKRGRRAVGRARRPAA